MNEGARTEMLQGFTKAMQEVHSRHYVDPACDCLRRNPRVKGIVSKAYSSSREGHANLVMIALQRT